MVDKDNLTKKFQKEMNAGVASLVLLCEMDKSVEPMYGYQIAKLLDSEVEPSVSGPPRRYYTITQGGREILEVWTEIWMQTKSFVDLTLKGTNHA